MPYRAYRTYRVNVSAKNLSSPPRKNPAAIAKTITTTVNRVVSSRLGHTDFLNSENVSCKKLTGLIFPGVLGETILVPRLETLAINCYLTSR